MKKIYLLLILLLVILVGGGFVWRFFSLANQKSRPSGGESSLSRIQHLGVIKIGSDLSLLPWGDVDQQTGEPFGGEVELARLIGQKLGVRVEFVNRSWDFIIEDLLNRRFDAIMAGMSITEERKKRIDFSDAYFTIGQVLTVRKGSGIESVDDLEGLVVGVMAATTSEAYARDLPQNFELTTYESAKTENLYPDLAAGTLDAVIFDSVASYWYVRNHPEANLLVLPALLTSEDYGMALRQEDEELKAALNKAIVEAKSDPQYRDILNRWYVLPAQ